MYVSIASLCTKTIKAHINETYTPPDSLGEYENLCFVFVQRMVCELLTLIYNALEIEFTVVIQLLKWPSCPHRDVQGKHHTLINVPVHGEQTYPSL